MRFIPKTLQELGPRRALIVAFAAGVLTLGLDAGLAHLAGRTLKHAGQLIPLVVGPLAFALLAAVALRADSLRVRQATRVVAAAVTATGLLGTAFHGVALMRFLAGSTPSLETLGVALAIAPPLFAPGGFVALGALLWAVVSPRLALTVQSGAGLPGGLPVAV